MNVVFVRVDNSTNSVVPVTDAIPFIKDSTLKPEDFLDIVRSKFDSNEIYMLYLPSFDKK